MGKDPYKVLRIDRGASSLEIERAYHKHMLNYGFDPRVYYTTEERETINKTISRIEDAYQTLSGPRQPASNRTVQSCPVSQEDIQRESSPVPENLAVKIARPGPQLNDTGGLDLSNRGTYNQYFGFNESPFNLTPDTKYFYLTTKHKEALAHLFFGLQEQKGFVVITGEVGTGKTILCRSFLTQLDDSVKVAYIFNPCLSDVELLQSINAELGIPSKSISKNKLISYFNQFLLTSRKEGKKVVVVIDEAQDLGPGTLEQLRLLSNLETETEKLLQIVLFGQPELLDTLREHKLRQLAQRITVRWSLSPLDLAETRTYIRHRIKVARSWGKVSFTNGAVKQIFKAGHGVPRMINVLADRALLVAYTLGRKSINRRIAYLAVTNYLRNSYAIPKPPSRNIGIAVTLTLALFFTLYIGPWGAGYFDATQTDRLIVKAKKMLGLESITGKPENLFIPLLPKKTATEEVETPPKKPRPPVAEDELGKLWGLTTDESHLRSLNAVLEVWQAPPVSEIERKGFLAGSIKDRGLALFSFQGDMKKMASYDYPMILEIVFSDTEAKKYLPITGISRKSISCDLERKKRVPINELKRWWNGKGIIIWKDFERLNYHLKLKDKGPQILWLQDSLEKLGFFKAKRKTSYFGKFTKEAVIRFQKTHHLTQDGVVGPEIKIRLYKLMGYPVPSLKN